MKTYKIIFSDRRKNPTSIEAKNLVEALRNGKELFGFGWAVGGVNQNSIIRALKELK